MHFAPELPGMSDSDPGQECTRGRRIMVAVSVSGSAHCPSTRIREAPLHAVPDGAGELLDSSNAQASACGQGRATRGAGSGCQCTPGFVGTKTSQTLCAKGRGLARGRWLLRIAMAIRGLRGEAALAVVLHPIWLGQRPGEPEPPTASRALAARRHHATKSADCDFVACP